MGMIKNLNEKLKNKMKIIDEKSNEMDKNFKKHPEKIKLSDFVRFKSQRKLTKLYKQIRDKKLGNALLKYESELKRLDKEKGITITDENYKYAKAVAKYELEKVKFNYNVTDKVPIRPESELEKNIKAIPNKVKDNAKDKYNNIMNNIDSVRNNAKDSYENAKNRANKKIENFEIAKENRKIEKAIDDFKIAKENRKIEKAIDDFEIAKENRKIEKAIEDFEIYKENKKEGTKKVFKISKDTLKNATIEGWSRIYDVKRNAKNAKHRVITGVKKTKDIIKLFKNNIKENVNNVKESAKGKVENAKEKVENAKYAIGSEFADIDQKAHEKSELRYNKRQEFFNSLKVTKDQIEKNSNRQEGQKENQVEKENQTKNDDSMER